MAEEFRNFRQLIDKLHHIPWLPQTVNHEAPRRLSPEIVQPTPNPGIGVGMAYGASAPLRADTGQQSEQA